MCGVIDMSNLRIYLDRHDSETNTKIDFIRSVLTAIVLFGAVIYVTREEAFINFEGTKSMIFSYVSAMIWLGFSNSISLWSLEEKYIVHRIRTGLITVPEYLASTCISQTMLSLIQAMIATVMFTYFEYEDAGLVFGSANIDIFITSFLSILGTSFLGIAIGMFCTSVKAAIGVLPIVLIAELLFSNGIFELTGVLLDVSEYIHSKHALSAIGSVLNIDEYPMKLKEIYPMIVQIDNAMFDYSTKYILECWMHLLLLCVIAVLISYVAINLKINKKK